MKTALARHDEILRTAIGANDGYVFTTAGDAFSAAFGTPRAAALAATESQVLLNAERWPTAGPVRVRMALHTGTAQERDGDYFGPALNRTARILAIGHGGQILMSAATRHVAGDDLPVDSSLVDLGKHGLKDLTQPERIFQLSSEGLVAEFPRLNSIEAFPHNLPQQLTTFVGREDSLREVRKLIGEERLLTITGVGGSGKTRLALQAGADALHEFRDGAWLVELAPVSDPRLVPHVVADTLGATTGDGRSVSEAIDDFLEHRQTLLILDNCEHVLRPAARLVDRLLRLAPDLRIVATSREGLGISGERLWQIPSLEVGDVSDDRFDWSEAVGWEGVRLFEERALAVQPAFRLTEETAPHVVAICQRLDGMPLAIELAAARARMLTVDQIAARLDDRFRLLTGGSRTALPRQQTLLATVEWSYELLSGPERLLFERLAAFRGGFTVDAAEAVCGGYGLEESEVLDLLGRLLDRSLILPSSHSAGTDRFTMLETIRQYSRARLTESGKADQVRERHAEYFLVLAEEASPGTETSQMVEWVDRLDTEHDNMRAALGWMLAAGRGVDALRMTVALSAWFWFIHRHHEEALDWHQRALKAGRDAPERLVALATAYASMQAMRILDERHGRAVELAKAVLGLTPAARQGRPEMIAVATLADVAMRDYDLPTATRGFREALQLAEAAEDDVWVSRLCHFLHMMYSKPVRGLESRQFAEQAVEAGERSGWTMGLAEGLGNLAEVELEAGDFERAEDLARRALTLEEALGDPTGIETVLGTLGVAARLRGNHQRTVSYAERAFALIERRGHRVDEVFVLISLAGGLLRSGDIDAAIPPMARALSTVRDLPLKYTPARALATAGMILTTATKDHEAVKAFAAADRLFEEAGVSPEPWDAQEFETFAIQARERLGFEPFQEAWNEGRSASIGAAIDEARRALTD